MELLLSRSQKTGIAGIGGISFVLDVRTQLSSQEDDYVRTYRLGSTVVYQKESVTDKLANSGLFKQLFTMLSARATGRMFTVNDLVRGRKVECKDIVEMLDAETQIKEAAEVFHTILITCQHFGGEEVVKYPRDE